MSITVWLCGFRGAGTGTTPTKRRLARCSSCTTSPYRTSPSRAWDRTLVGKSDGRGSRNRTGPTPKKIREARKRRKEARGGEHACAPEGPLGELNGVSRHKPTS